jgi:thioredoxin 1
MEHVTKQDWESVISKPLVLVEFWADWCAPCKMMKPILERLEQEITTLDVALVNADLEKELVSELEITAIPTMMLFKNGELVWKITGAKPFPWYVEKIGPYV